jgi:hypothetical protein
MILKLLKFTRYSEWWEYKLVPLLAIAYATMQVAHLTWEAVDHKLIFALLAIIIGAIYVSVINDITDIEEDFIAGKVNRMAAIAPVYRMIIVAASLALGIFCGFFIYPNLLGLFFYSMAWVAFSLYSLPPIRLKKRGIWGVLCDAMGAHFFPTLFIVSSLAPLTNSAFPLWWYFGVGIWSFTYGLRGILWHQFFDRNNDLKSGTATFASKNNPDDFIRQELIIFIIEVTAFSTVFLGALNLWTAASLGIYIVLVLIRTFFFKYRIALIITPNGEPHQILMNDFYLVFFPLSLLLTSALAQPRGWIFLCCHLLLFPRKTLLVVQDMMFFLKAKLRE